MNINNLQVQLQTAVENAATEASTDNTSATLYYLQLAKAVQALNMGQIRTIDQVSNLPSAATSEGWLYFVQDIERLYFSNGTAWADIIPAPVYDNTIWSWGNNTNGKLGDNTIANKSSPVSVVGGFTDWCQISANRCSSFGIKQDGTAWAWGDGTYGVLGNNCTSARSSPVSVVGGYTDWCQLSADRSHALAVRQNGTLWAWGYGAAGQLGTNNTTTRSSPVSVVGGFTDWCQVAVGAGRGVAVRQNGTAWAWGSNICGSLGDGTTVSKSSPVSVVGGFCDWCQVSSGVYMSLGVRTNGTAWTWGRGTYGALGDGTASNKSSPVSVIGGYTDWCQVCSSSVSENYALGLRQNGTLWTWGANGFRQLGDGTNVAKTSPVSVAGGFTDWCQASFGGLFGSGIRTNGQVWSWGYNQGGRLGNGTTTLGNGSPVSVVGGFTDWYLVSTGYNSAIAIRSTQV